MFQWLKLYEAETSSSLFVQLKLKCWLKKPLHDDITEAQEVYIQLSSERYSMKLVLHLKPVSICVDIQDRSDDS